MFVRLIRDSTSQGGCLHSPMPGGMYPSVCHVSGTVISEVFVLHCAEDMPYAFLCACACVCARACACACMCVHVGMPAEVIGW